MAWTKAREKSVKSSLIAGKVLRILESHNLLNKRVDRGVQNWNGKKVMVSTLTNLDMEQLEELEEEIKQEVNSIL